MRRDVLRPLLQSVGLMDVAREARGAAASIPWLRDNAGFWLRGSADGFALPPLRLVRSSTGTSSLRWYLDGGRLAADSVRAALARQGSDIGRVGSLLDFGCGSGRVIRHWSGLPAAVHGCDYNRAAVRWCARHLPFARFAVNGLTPPLPYEDRQFDVVYALSVFTHLPEPLAFEWLAELERIVKPGGALLITVHGQACLDQLNPDEQSAFRAGLAVVKDARSPGTNRCGVYVSEAYVRSRFVAGFQVADFVRQGATGNPPQDLVLLRRV